MNVYFFKEELLKEFKVFLESMERSKATVEKYMRDVGAFARKYPQIDKETVLRYKEEITENYKPASVNSMLAALNCFFRFMGWLDCLVKPLKIQRCAFCPEEKMLTREDFSKLVQTARTLKMQRLSLIMETQGATAIRISELKAVTVEAVKIGCAVIRCKGKIRNILLPTKLCRKLICYAGEKKITAGSIFISRNGKPLDRSNIWSAMKKLCSAAGVEARRVFPHNLRHLFARLYYSLEKDIAKLADVLGHTSIDTTRIYILSDGVEHRKLLDRLGLILET